MLGKVLVGALVAAGLFLIYSIFSSGNARADGVAPSTGGNMGTPRPLDKSGTFQDKSGGKLGIDAVTGKPFKAGSTFAEIASGKRPFTFGNSAGNQLSFTK